MKKIPETLAQRRERLTALCQAQREDLTRQRQLLGQSFGTVFNVRRLADKIRKNPLLLAGAVLGLSIIRPRRLFSFIASAAMAWQAWQKIAPIMAVLLKRHSK